MSNGKTCFCTYNRPRYQVSVYRTIGPLVTIYGNDGHLGHMIRTIYTKVHSPFPKRIHVKFGFHWPSGFKGEQGGGQATTHGRRSMDIL